MHNYTKIYSIKTFVVHTPKPMSKGASVNFLTIEGRVLRFKYIYYFLIASTFGLYGFIARLYPSIRTYFETKKSSIINATHILVIGHDFRELCTVKKFFFPFVSMRLKRFISANEIRFFETQYCRLFYDIKTHKYVPADNKVEINKALISKKNNEDINKKIAEKYLKKEFNDSRYVFDKVYRKYFFSDTYLLEKYILYGSNDIELKPKPFSVLLGDILLDPLFLYNAVGIVIWLNIDYMYYAFTILMMTIYSFVIDILSEMRKNKNLTELSQLQRIIKVLRGGNWTDIPVNELFPGDIFYIDQGVNFPCDAKIIKGEIIVDESFLTGETVPVFKAAGINDCVVYAGTHILKSVGEDIRLEDQRSDVMNSLVKVRSIKKRQTRNGSRRNINNSSEKLPLETDLNTEVLDYNCIETENAKDMHNLHDCIDEGEKKASGRAICKTISTRYDTAKGRLVKNIILPKKINFFFEKQSKQVILFIFVFGVIISVILGFYLASKSIPIKKAFEFSTDLIFCLLSPALPATISIGSTIAIKRLLKHKITCNESGKINQIGQTDLLIFDKTGTLTEEGLDLYCIDDIDTEYYSLDEIMGKEKILEGLSVCHTVYEIDDQLVGDPLDIKMFMFSQSGIFNSQNKRFVRIGSDSVFEGPLLKEVTDNDDSIHYYKKVSDRKEYNRSLEIIKAHEFDNKLRRMSVVVKDETQNMFLFAKGSPESIHNILNNPDDDFYEVVNDHSLDGYRVLAMGYKKLFDCESLSERKDYECDLEFLCFIVFANKLKSETKPVLESLHNAKLKVLMATGDGILTAISVGRQAKLIDKFTPVIFPVLEEGSKTFFEADWLCIGDEELVFDKIKMTLHRGEDRISYDDFYVACEGREYDAIKKEGNGFYTFLMEKGAIFARMNPDQKKSLVEDFNSFNKKTLFCGDGANDCGALRSADIGLALAENEASLASSFASSVKNISSVLRLLQEGRCALVTSFSRFQFILLTCFIQYIPLLGLMCNKMFLSEMQTIHIDLFLVLPIAFIMTEFRSNDTLDSSVPDHLLFKKYEIFRILGHIFINGICVLVPLQLLCPVSPNGTIFMIDTLPSTFTFYIVSCQTIFMGILFMKGLPHRESIRKRKSVILMLFIAVLMHLFLLINCYYQLCPYLNKKYYFVKLESKYFIGSIGICFINCVLNIILETIIKYKKHI